MFLLSIVLMMHNIESYYVMIIFRLVGVFRMVLQKLIQDGHLEVRESLIDMNNTVLKVRLETRKKKKRKHEKKKEKKKTRIISSTGFKCRHTLWTESQWFNSCRWKISEFFQSSLTS